MKKVFEEFKEFAIKGNMVDMAVGIVIGGAFGKIVSSLVEDVIMPPLGVLVGGMDFSFLSLTLKEAQGALPAVTWRYGKFLQTSLDFLIVAFAMFVVVKALNVIKRKQQAAVEQAASSVQEAPRREEVLLAEIRDALREQNRR